MLRDIVPMLTFVVACLLVTAVASPALSKRSGLTRKSSSAIDAAWICRIDSPTTAAQKLAHRYLNRVRSHRRLGFWVGLALSLTLGIAGTSVNARFPDTRIFADIMFGSITGTLAGSLIAETWRLRPTSSRRSAHIGDQPALSSHPRWALAGLAIIAASVALATVDRQATIIALAGCTSTLAAVHLLVQRAIKNRGRPALPDDLLQADNMIRNYGIRRLEHEMVAGATLLFAWQLSLSTFSTDGLAGIAITAATSISLLVSLQQMWRSRPWPPAAPTKPAVPAQPIKTGADFK